jgi:hypothetical protein
MNLISVDFEIIPAASEQSEGTAWLRASRSTFGAPGSYLPILSGFP